jgi:hypothetical protein
LARSRIVNSHEFITAGGRKHATLMVVGEGGRMVRRGGEKVQSQHTHTYTRAKRDARDGREKRLEQLSEERTFQKKENIYFERRIWTIIVPNDILDQVVEAL